MRRFAVLALVVPLLAAGCGGDEGSSGPLDEGLRYLPEDAPFAVAIDTNLDGDQYRAARGIADRFPLADQAEKELEEMFERDGQVDFERDVKPLLGNPFVVGAADAKNFDGDGYVGAIQVEDEGKLGDLVDKAGGDEKGEKAGAKLYEDSSGDTYAVQDDVLVVAGSRKLLEDALERRGGGDTLTEEKFDSALRDLPKESLVRLYLDLEALIRGSRDGREATRIEWVGALRTLGLVAQARSDSVVLPFRLRTDPDGLTDEDLPFAIGGASPRVVQRDGEVGVGVRDAGQIVKFSLDATVASQGPAVEVAKRQLESQLDIDVEDDIVRQLSGDTSLVATPSGRYGVRAELRDPAEFERTLAKLAPSLPRVIESLGGGPTELSRPRTGEDFYTLAQPGGSSVVFGVSRGVLVLTQDAESARSLAAAKPTVVRGAKGSVVLSADAQKLADAILDDFSGLGLLGLVGVTKPLGDLTGAVTTSTSGMRGTLEQRFD
jgi:hypothetical protein